jgi:hypothetical protein
MLGQGRSSREIDCKSHGESVVRPQVAPVSSSVDKVSVIDTSARRRDLFLPQSIQSSIGLPNTQSFPFKSQEERPCLACQAGFFFWVPCFQWPARVWPQPSPTLQHPGRMALNSCVPPCWLSPGTGWVSLGRESVLQISLGNVSLRQNSALGKPLRNYSLPSLEASGQEGIVWGQSPPVTKGPFRGADGVGGTPAACASGHMSGLPRAHV